MVECLGIESILILIFVFVLVLWGNSGLDGEYFEDGVAFGDGCLKGRWSFVGV